MVPHFRLGEDHLLYLEREKIALTKEERTVLKKVTSNEGVEANEMNTLNRFIAEKTVLEMPEVNQIVNIGDNIIFAAHSDDAALSMGGHLLLGRDKYKIVTVFNTCPISFSLKKYNLTAEEVTEYNNAEEEFYAQSVKAELHFMNYKEALERNYTFERIFKGDILAGDKKLYNDIKKTIYDIMNESFSKNSTFYFPLAVGNHVDHKILFQIGLELTKEFHFVIRFYEDLPYALGITGEADEWVRHIRGITREPTEVDVSTVIEKKEDMIRIYRSQFDPLSIPELAQYARKIGRYRAIERVW
jgi:LmbE family N-acetylglucosaminyl deacetylase